MRLALSSNRHQHFGLLQAFLLIGGRGALRPDPPPSWPALFRLARGVVLFVLFRFFSLIGVAQGFRPAKVKVKMWETIWLKPLLVSVSSASLELESVATAVKKPNTLNATSELRHTLRAKS